MICWKYRKYRKYSILQCSSWWNCSVFVGGSVGVGHLLGVAYSHMDAEIIHRSHFGSRYHTRADAVTQAFFSLRRINPEWSKFVWRRRHKCSIMRPFFVLCIIRRQRPYRVECTGSLPNSEVKRRRARLVLGWGTAREDLRVLLAFWFAVLCRCC